jgi:outer membrane receptor for ferrienterochelin and colicins
LTNIDNITMGARFYQRAGNRGKLAIDVFSINEDRRGGNRFDYPLHEADIAEAVTHKIQTGAATYEHFTRDYDLFSLFISAQKVGRDSYYGANRSLSDYGRTDDMTYNAGMQYKAIFDRSTLTSGLEYTRGLLIDKKLAYAGSDNTIIANQQMATASLFAQHDIKWEQLLVSAGGRIDRFSVVDRDGHNETKQGLVISPRMNLLYDIRKNFQIRLSYSKGFRAPQIFDEDLHIESSGSRKVIHENHPELKEETSHSITASLEANSTIKNSQLRFLLETFYTRLIDPFANEYGEPNEDRTVVYTRVNADGGALVRGINTELNLAKKQALTMTLGFTVQSNHYDEVQEFDETRFFRTPNHYGFLTADFQLGKNWRINATSNYTGSMLVPYFGPGISRPEEGMLRKSKPFFELGLGTKRNIVLANTDLQLIAGVKNLLNAYQSDFDQGIDRDPGYMYGPTLPRTIYIGITLSGKGK